MSKSEDSAQPYQISTKRPAFTPHPDPLPTVLTVVSYGHLLPQPED